MDVATLQAAATAAIKSFACPPPSGDATGATDTAAIQAKIDAAYAAGGGIVSLRGGTYYTKISTGDTALCLRMRSGVTLLGAGKRTILKAAANLPATVYAVLGIEDGAWGTTVDNLTIDGNAANQSLGAPGGIYYVQSLANQPGPYTMTIGTGTIGSSAVHTIQNVFVVNVAGIGIWSAGNVSETHIDTCEVFNCGKDGIRLDGDSHVVNSTAGGVNGVGIWLGLSCRAANCKVYCAGLGGGGVTVKTGLYIAPASADFVEASNIELAAITGDAVIVAANGASLTGIKVCGATGSGIWIKPNVSNCIVTGSVSPRTYSIGAYTPTRAVYVDTGCTNNQVRLTANGYSSSAVGGSAANNDVSIGAQQGAQSVAYAATVTPNPYNGGTVIIASLTGNLTLANPSDKHTGCRMTVVLPQDATGGRTVTFGANYKTTGAVSTTASTTTTISFIYDGSFWRETDRTAT